ncbi:unnamed protein product [Didymodactylos carnosus]|uniref:Uncharacterized protein n=1 Tax=Didymodactylos carnosus TaxID=1234261 RepID=A0A8S2DGD6_9BILA|nr:unnamed protein product [Didymodactylos carnosus]CAF3700141.1 unnamed protein product [Didymodactylos carnosus]
MLLKNDAKRHRLLVLFHSIDSITFLIRFIIICTDLSADTGNITNYLSGSRRYLIPILFVELFSSFILFLADLLYVILKYIGDIFYETDRDDICNERRYLWPLATLTCFKKIDCYYDNPRWILLTRIWILIGFWLLRFIAVILACACGNQYAPRGHAINHTETKAHYFGAYICVKVNLGRIFLTKVRGVKLTEEQRVNFDSVYFQHPNGVDEFCVLRPEQILSWVITVNQDADVTNQYEEPRTDNITDRFDERVYEGCF